MRKIEVSGAFITPDMTPAMPTSVNETTEIYTPGYTLSLHDALPICFIAIWMAH